MNKKTLKFIIISFLFFSLLLMALVRIKNNYDSEANLYMKNINTNFFLYIDFLLPTISALTVVRILSERVSKNNFSYFRYAYKHFENRIYVDYIEYLLIFNLILLPLYFKFSYNYLNEAFSFNMFMVIYLNGIFNSFIISAITLYLNIVISEFSYVFGMAIFYMFFDYFSDGRFMKRMTLYPLGFLYSDSSKIFYINRVIYIFVALILLAISHQILTKTKNIWLTNIMIY